MNKKVTIRKATADDVDAMVDLIAFYEKQGKVLKRDRADLLFYLKNFLVAVDDDNVLCGCGAVRDFGDGLYELRSLVVSPDCRGCGIGGALVRSLVEKLRDNNPDSRLFTLTCEPEFFKRVGFELSDRNQYPAKIWSDCAKCPRNDNCNETALEYPKASEG